RRVFGVERGSVNGGARQLCGRCKIKVVAAVGQEIRFLLPDLLRRIANRRWFSSGSQYALQSFARRKKDCALAVPGTAKKIRCLTNILGRTAHRFHFLQLAGSEESNRPAIRRPEKPAGALGARKLRPRLDVDRADKNRSRCGIARRVCD